MRKLSAGAHTHAVLAVFCFALQALGHGNFGIVLTDAGTSIAVASSSASSAGERKQASAMGAEASRPLSKAEALRLAVQHLASSTWGCACGFALGRPGWGQSRASNSRKKNQLALEYVLLKYNALDICTCPY